LGWPNVPFPSQDFKRCPSLNDEPLLFKAQADIVKQHLDTKELHSPAYPLNCAGCTNPMCRTIVNPIKPYTKLL
jgi:ferrochelatase